MNQDKQLEYYTKINTALSTLFDDENETGNFIDIYSDDFSANDFFHALATRVPQMIMAKLTGNEYDPLAFNHAMNRLIMQDRLDQK